MHIDPKGTIVGYPALKVRDLFKKIGDGSVSSEFIARHLEIPEGEADTVAGALLKDGHLALDDQGTDGGTWYKSTLRENTLRQLLDGPTPDQRHRCRGRDRTQV